MAASQRVRSRVPAPHRSILPSMPGIPAGGAILLAVACAFVGFMIDAAGGGGELTGTFAVLYTIGCVVAVSVVRYRGLFSTMALPPLLLFVAVPSAYWQLTGQASTSVKDILLNLAVPLVNRFPTMMVATIIVLLLGGARVVLHRQTAPATPETGRRAGRGTARGTKATSGRTTSNRAAAARRGGPRSKDSSRRADTATRSTRRTSDAQPPARARTGRPRPGGAPQQTRAVPRAGGEPARGAGRRDLPPRPQPTVRYRDRQER